MKIALRFFAALVKLYPAGFWQEFAEEMREVFSDRLAVASRQGLRAVVCLMLHELVDWPGALLREHFGELRRRKESLRAEMVTSLAGGADRETGPRASRGRGGEARRAGFPHGLVFCLAALGVILQGFPMLEEETGPGFVLAMGLVILFWVTLIGAVGWSLRVVYRAHWPGWSASWYGYVLALVAVPVLGWLQNSDAATRGGWDQVVFGGGASGDSDWVVLGDGVDRCGEGVAAGRAVCDSALDAGGGVCTGVDSQSIEFVDAGRVGRGGLCSIRWQREWYMGWEWSGCWWWVAGGGIRKINQL